MNSCFEHNMEEALGDTSVTVAPQFSDIKKDLGSSMFPVLRRVTMFSNNRNTPHFLGTSVACKKGWVCRDKGTTTNSCFTRLSAQGEKSRKNESRMPWSTNSHAQHIRASHRNFAPVNPASVMFALPSTLGTCAAWRNLQSSTKCKTCCPPSTSWQFRRT